MLTASPIHYMAAHPGMLPGAHRLRAALVQATGRPFKAKAVEDFVVTCFRNPQFARWAPELDTRPIAWTVIELVHPLLRERHDWTSLAESVTEAVGFLYNECAICQLNQPQISRTAKGWSAIADGAEIARIRSAELRSAPAEAARRVEGLFEGLHQYGDDERLTARLRTLPGFEHLIGSESRRDRPPEGPALLDTASSMVKVLRRNISEAFDVDLTQGAAQECLARALGHQDWNTLVAFGKSTHDRASPCGIYIGASGPILYRSVIDAFWAAGHMARTKELPPYFATLGAAGLQVFAAPVADPLYTEPFATVGAPEIVAAESEEQITRAERVLQEA